MRRFLPVFLSAIFISAGAANGQLLSKQYQDSAKAYLEKRDYKKAIEFFFLERSFLRGDTSLRALYAENAENLAMIYDRNLEDYEKAVPLFTEAMTIRESLFGKSHPLYAKSCNLLGVAYLQMDSLDKAAPLLHEALEIRLVVSGRLSLDYTQSCNYLGYLYQNKYEFERAEYYFKELVAVHEKVSGKDAPYYAQSCHSLGRLYIDMGQYAKAEPYLLEAREAVLRTRGKLHRNYTFYSNLLAVTYKLKGDYAKAENLYLELRGLMESAGKKETEDYGTNSNNLANIYSRLGDYKAAAKLHLEAKMLNEKLEGRKESYAQNCMNLGIDYEYLGQFEQAEILLTEAKNVYEAVTGKESEDYEAGCFHLGKFYMNQGRFDKAEPLLLESIILLEKLYGKEHESYADGCINLGEFYLRTGRYAESDSLLGQGLVIIQKSLGENNMKYLVASDLLANLYRLRGMNEKAGAYYTSSFGTLKNQVRDIFSFTNEMEKQAFLASMIEFQEDFLSFAFSNTGRNGFDQGITFNLVQFMRSLIVGSASRLRGAIHDSGDSVMIHQYKLWVECREELAHWLSKPAGERKGRDSVLIAKANVIEKEITKRTGIAGLITDNTDWKSVQAALKEGEAAVEFSSFRYFDGQRRTDSIFYIALLLRKDSQAPELIPLFESKQLAVLINQRGSGTSPQQVNFIYSATGRDSRKLSELVWKPLEKRLTGIRNVYFAPAGLLHKISLAALPLDNLELVSDRYRLVQLNSTAVLYQQPSEGIVDNGSILIYGGIQYNADSASLRRNAGKYATTSFASRSVPEELKRNQSQDFVYLNGTEREAAAIQSMAAAKGFTVTYFRGTDASEESFKSMNGKHSPQVIHIATHGFFFPDPRQSKIGTSTGNTVAFRQSDNPLIRSGLALAGANNTWKGKPVTGVEDGILTAYEVSNMYLPNTKLAVLSACETGLGDIQGSEGVYGLQRAFKLAGVENLVMSLWKVPDAETAEFMQAFYQRLFTGSPVADAFRQAQQLLKNKYRNEPYRWAAWILVR